MITTIDLGIYKYVKFCGYKLYIWIKDGRMIAQPLLDQSKGLGR